MSTKGKKLPTLLPDPAALEKLLSISQSLIVVRDLKSLLKKIARTAGSILGADVVVLYEYREETDDVVVPPVIWGNIKFPKVLRARGRERPHRDSAVFKMLSRQRPVYAPDATRDWSRLVKSSASGDSGSFTQREGIVSSAAVRLTAAGRSVGVLFVNYRSARRFDQAERRTIQLFAAQAAVAIQNARLLEREGRLRRQAGTLRDVAVAISSAISLEDVSGQILDNVHRMVKYDKATMQIVRGDVRDLIAYRGFEKADIAPQLLRPISQDALIKRVVTAQRPVILTETKQDPDWEVYPQTANVYSWIGLPLVYRDQTIGLITLDHHKAGTYTRELEGLLIQLAHQAAVAVENARLFDDRQHRIRDLQILNDIAQIMAVNLNTLDLLRTIASRVVKELKCTHCTIFSPVEQEGQIWLLPQVVEGKHQGQIATRKFRIGEGLAGWAFQHGEALMLPDASIDPRFAKARERRGRPRSMLIAPILVGDQIRSVIVADQDEYGWFSINDLSLLKALARQAGIAIQRNTGLQLVQDIGNQINSARKVEEILRFIVSGAIDLTHTTSGVIYLVGKDGRSIAASYKYPPDSFHPAPRMDKEDGSTRRVIATGDVLIFSDLAQDERVNPELRERARSMIAVPLKHVDKVIGVLYLNDRDFHEFTETEVSLLTTLSNQAATAIAKEQQVDRHRMLNDVGAQLIGLLKDEDIFNAVARAVADTLDCTHCSVFRIEPAGLVVRAAQGNLERDLPLGRTFNIGEGVAGWVAKTGKSALVAYTPEDARFDPNWSSPPPQSLVNVPIVVDQQVYGVISVEHERPGAFDEQDRRLVETLALQVGQAIRNARRIHELEVLYAAGQRFSRQLDREALFETLLDTVNTTLEGLYSTLFLVDASNILVARMRRGKGADEDLSALRFRLGEGLAGRVAQDRKSLIIADVDQDSRAMPSRTIPHGHPHSMLLVPLMLPDRLLGVISMDKDVVSGFNHNDQRLLETMCAQAAIALENARLFAESQQQAAELALLHDISMGWMRRDLNTLLGDIMKGAMRLTSTELGAIYLLSEDGRRIIQSVSFPEDFSYLKFQLSESGLTRQIYEGGEPIFVPDTSQDERVSSIVEQYGIKSFIGQPLKTGEWVMGVLYLNDLSHRQFSVAERKLIATLASQAAIAIENARLNEQRRRDTEAIRQIVQIVGTIGAEADPLPIILEEAVELFRADNGSFARVDPSAGRISFQVIREHARTYLESEVPEDRRLRGWNEGAIGKVAREGTVYLTGDAEQDPFYERWSISTASALVVPLKASTENIIGVLSLESSERDFFGESEEALCQDLASIAAMAIEKGRLFDAMQQLNRQIEGLHTVVQEKSTEQVLDRVLQGINLLLGETASSSINLYEQTSNSLYSYRAAGVLKDYLLGVPPRPSGTSSYVLEHGHPLYLDDVRNPPPGVPTIRPESIARGVVSFAALPLRWQDRVVGMLFVNLQTSFHFADEIKRILELFASQAAIAIENAQFLEDLQRRVRYLDALNRVTRCASDNKWLDPREVFQMVVQEAHTTLAAKRCTLFTLNDEGVLLPQAMVGVDQAAAKLAYRFGEGLAGWVAQEGRSERVPDALQDSRFVADATVRSDVARSMVLAPIWVEGTVSGVLSVDREAEIAFDEIDQLFLETLAVQAGILWRQQTLRRQRMEGFRRQRNPYVVGEPIRNPEGFFGRRSLIHQVMNGIHQNSFILFGERRIGKTSLLFQLENRLQDVSHQNDPYYFLPIFVELQGIPESDFFESLIKAISRKLPLQPQLTIQSLRADQGHIMLEDMLETLVPILEQQHPNRTPRIVLLLDEMDKFASYGVHTHEQFRSFLQTRIGEYLKLVMAGSSVQRVSQMLTSPWFNLFEAIEIPELGPAAARQLVVEPVRGYYRYAPDALRLLLDRTDYKPCEIQRLGAKTVEAMLARVHTSGRTLDDSIAAEIDIQLDDALKAADQILLEKDGEFQELWARFNDDQRSALKSVQAGDGLIDTAVMRPDGRLFFEPEDLYNITRREGKYRRLTYMFSEWLKGV